MAIPTVSFDSLNSSTTFGMILQDYVISPAVRKTQYISVPGRSGDLDLSDFLGAAYNNRTITITLVKEINAEDLDTWQSDLETQLNGHRMKVTFSNDPSYYWDARLSVTSVTKVGWSAVQVVITGNADPYKIHITTEEKVL